MHSQTDNNKWGIFDEDVEVRAAPESNNRWGYPPVLAETFCVMLFGERGSGKSALMVKWLKEEAEAGKPVWYWPPDLKIKFRKGKGIGEANPIDAEELFSLPRYMKHGAVGIDEIQVLLNRMRTVSIANQMGGTMLQQLRKNDLNVYGTSNQPERIDGSVEKQTTLHYWCKLIQDPSCLKRGYHPPSCTDHVRYQYTDTNNKYGHDYKYRDGRKRGRWFELIRETYDLYNTHSIADYGDVLELNKESILERRAERKSKIKGPALQEALRSQWIPWAVKQGHRQLTPGIFAVNINDKFGLNVSGIQVGIALKNLGLETRSNGQARVFELPPLDRLDAWLAGF